jgi:hypothetical protein
MTIEQTQETADVVDAAAAGLRAFLRDIVDALAEFADRWRACTWRIYRSAGMPYGESEEGLSRWWKETCRQGAREREADAEEQSRQWWTSRGLEVRCVQNPARGERRSG